MNKKGFTLIELLAVIVILGVVMLIGTVSIANVRNKMNKNMFEAKVDLILGTAKSWGQDNKELFGNSLVSCYNKIAESTEQKTFTGVKVKVQELINSGDLQTEEKDATGNLVVINDYTGSSANNLEILVYLKNNRVYACIPLSTIPPSNNLKILGEKKDETTGEYTFEEYKDSNFYCSC